MSLIIIDIKNIDMKKIYTLLLVLLILTGFNSCEDFLNEQPQSDFTEEGTGEEDLSSKYQNAAEAIAELTGASDGALHVQRCAV
jgi:hypothetical protein